MLASVIYGASIVYARHLLRDHDAVTLTTVKLSSGAIQAFLLMVALEGMPGYGSLSREGWLLLAVLGAAGTAAAYLLHFWAVARVGSVRGSMVIYISPPSSMLLGWLILGETLTMPMFVGLALIVAAVATVMFAPTIELHLKKAWCGVPGRNSASCRALATAA
jgi:drug/metabolite transporter (DMT)-like permease